MQEYDFNTVLDSLCKITKPILKEKIPNLEYFFFFYHDIIENVLYFKGKDDDFVSFLQSYGLDEYGRLIINRDNPDVKGTVLKLFYEVESNPVSKLYYYPDINRDPKAENIPHDEALCKKFNKEYYSALFLPLIATFNTPDNTKKEVVVGISCFVLNKEITFSDELLNGGKDVFITKFGNLKNKGRRKKFKSSDYNFVINLFAQISNSFQPVYNNNIRNQGFAVRHLYKLLYELQRTNTIFPDLVDELLKTLRNSTSDGQPLKKVVTDYIVSKTPMGEIVKEYQDYEEILLRNKNYRDHFIHMFRVFIEGIFVIFHLIEKKKLDSQDIIIRWTNISLIHDFGYPIELFQKWSNSLLEIFKEDPNGKDIEITLAIQNILLNKEFAFSLNLISNQLKEDCNSKLETFFQKLIHTSLFEYQDHGILSALMFLSQISEDKIQLKSLSDGDKVLIKKYKNEIAFPIAFHNFSAWKHFLFYNPNTFDELKINYKKAPLVFILAYIDAIQEYGRPDCNYFTENEKNIVRVDGTIIRDENISIFEKIDIIDNKIITEITFYNNLIQYMDVIDPLQYKLDLKNIKRKNKFNKKIFEVMRFVDTFESTDIHFEFKFNDLKYGSHEIKFCTCSDCVDCLISDPTSDKSYWEEPILRGVYRTYTMDKPLIERWQRIDKMKTNSRIKK